MRSLGLMSGTSMDGIDAALLDTDGEAHVASIAHVACPYPTEIQVLLKAAERAVRLNQGSLFVADFEAHLQAYLTEECGVESPMLSLYRECAEVSGILTLGDVIRLSARRHVLACQALLMQEGIETVDVVGYHGQTVYHNPLQAHTVQLGDASLLAQAMQCRVVHQFRQKDMEHGGQGAPLAPVYHRALAGREGLLPCVVVNCGGIANATLVTSDELVGFDTGPGNCLLDRFIQFKTQGRERIDRDGRYALQGHVNDAVFQALFARSCLIRGECYYELPAPKSLDNRDVCLIPEVRALSIEDGAATLASFTAFTIARSIMAYSACARVILVGGGWHHPRIVSELRRYLPRYAIVQHASDVGWKNDALEAELCAYLAVRRLKGLPASFPSVTGVAMPVIGGEVVSG